MISLRVACFSLIVLLVSCEGCKDDPEPIPEIQKLPPATQTGARTFGCLIDGKAWVVTGYVEVFAMYQEGIPSILAEQRRNTIDRAISIEISNADLQPGTYELTKLPEGRGVLSELFMKNCGYETSNETRGTLTINHFDPEKLIVSGTFEFEAFSSGCNELVKVTEGRFDLVYAP